MARSLMDSVAAEHLDVGRAFEHFDAARSVLEQGPPHRALGHLEVGVATARTYALRIADGLEAAERGMAIGEAVGDELLWAGAAEAFGWHALVAGRLREGFDAEARAFAVADRHRRSFLAFMATNIQGQFTWGIGAPDDAQAHFERPLRLPYAGDAAYRRQTVDGVGRCHASRGELDAARLHLPDAQATWITHSLKPVLDLWDGDLDAVAALAAATLATSRRTGNRWDEWASQALAARVLALRSAHAEAVPLLEEAHAILVAGGAVYFELWLLPDLARSLAELGRAAEARERVTRCREITAGGEDWRGRIGMIGVADGIVLALEGEPDAADAAFAAAVDVLRSHRLAGEEADALHQWGRALALPERLEEAAEAYRRHGAGRLWLDRVEADRRALR
jgi:tetratricopeptide (TPR) repeat protein